MEKRPIDFKECDCNKCNNKKCLHKGTYRRLPKEIGGLGLCKRIKDTKINKLQEIIK